ncbi:MAG: ribonuclease HI [Desulfobacterales bacterium]
MSEKKKFYAVAKGHKPGIYLEWYGPNGAQVQVDHFPGAVFRGFATRPEAEAFLGQPRAARIKPRPSAGEGAASPAPTGGVIIYTDGSALNNPGPGGYGVVILEGGRRTELSGGFRKTTNNRMELLACIKGLDALTTPATVTLYSDSAYVVNGITRGWAKSWQRKGWRKSNGEPALNPDLWEKLLGLCQKHAVRFVWVKGHAGNTGNERCDQLATRAAAGAQLPPDTAYEQALRQK